MPDNLAPTEGLGGESVGDGTPPGEGRRGESSIRARAGDELGCSEISSPPSIGGATMA